MIESQSPKSIIRTDINGVVDQVFNSVSSPLWGSASTRGSIVKLSDGSIIVQFDSTLYKLDPITGVPDSTFNTNVSGISVNQNAEKLLIDSNNKIVSLKPFIRLNEDGTTDTSINVGTGFTGGPVSPWGITDTVDGYIVVGWFTAYDGYAVSNIAKILTDGTNDTVSSL